MPIGGRRKKGRRKAPATQLDELDEEALVEALRRFVGNSRLSTRRIAGFMGVSSITLDGWIGGTIRPRKKKLLDIKSFLGCHAPDCLLSIAEDRA
jgi:hypothetical protein